MDMTNNLDLNTYQTSHIIQKNSGMLIIDEVNGFCTVGAGNLAPLKKKSSSRQYG